MGNAKGTLLGGAFIATETVTGCSCSIPSDESRARYWASTATSAS